MAISELVELVAPPKKPVQRGNERKWKSINKKLGVELPSDYYDYGITYGSGEMCNGFIRILNWATPFFLKFVTKETENIRGGGGYDTEKLPVYPEPGGLLPWGFDECGTTLCWKTEGDSETWPIVTYIMEGEYSVYPATMTGFLAQVFSNKLKCRVWQEPFEVAELNFTPSPQ